MKRRLALSQPDAFAFSPANASWAKQQIKKYPPGRQASAVVPLLWRAQQQAGGWLPEPAMRHVAELLDMPSMRVLEIASFYSMLNLAPAGKCFVQVCGTTPCWLRGAEALKEICRKEIGAPNQPDADGLMCWTEVECLGACVNAPVVQLGEDYYENLTPESFASLIAKKRAKAARTE